MGEKEGSEMGGWGGQREWNGENGVVFNFLEFFYPYWFSFGLFVPS
jgi:hypothetical protein